MRELSPCREAPGSDEPLGAEPGALSSRPARSETAAGAKADRSPRPPAPFPRLQSPRRPASLPGLGSRRGAGGRCQRSTAPGSEGLSRPRVLLPGRRQPMQAAQSRGWVTGHRKPRWERRELGREGGAGDRGAGVMPGKENK